MFMISTLPNYQHHFLLNILIFEVPFKQRFLSNSHDDLAPHKYVLQHSEAEHVALVKPGGVDDWGCRVLFLASLVVNVSFFFFLG